VCVCVCTRTHADSAKEILLCEVKLATFKASVYVSVWLWLLWVAMMSVIDIVYRKSVLHVQSKYIPSLVNSFVHTCVQIITRYIRVTYTCSLKTLE